MDILKDLPQPVLMLALIVSVWLAKELWDSRKKVIEKNSDLLQQNTLALVELKVEIRSIKDVISGFAFRMDKAEKDINAIHDYKRKVKDNGL